MGMITSNSRRSQDDGSSGAASPCRRIDPKTGAVIGFITAITVPAAQLTIKPGWRSKKALRRPTDA